MNSTETAERPPKIVFDFPEDNDARDRRGEDGARHLEEECEAQEPGVKRPELVPCEACDAAWLVTVNHTGRDQEITCEACEGERWVWICPECGAPNPSTQFWCGRDKEGCEYEWTEK